ncbi:IS1634 family transposase [Sporosarcina limicola]|uniref:Transposase n=1 Tax=Sporosarcina limicola TaxID=34101 RepID=A0A927MQ87_9BACL|nr:IS1634 family transposase [Sporosarcina limicola]MBE1556977.1 transposase [Sporosarcina limicola]
MKQPDQILTLSAGPSQLISAICDEIGFEKTINEQLDWDKDRCHLSPGARIKALVINILCGKEPLYHIHHFFKEQDVEMLFGSHVKAGDLNEYSIGRALDALYKATPWKVYSTLSVSTCRKLGFSLSTLHNDTTSYSLYGDYKKTNDATEETTKDLEITYGYSKQHRPDLKQIVLGMSVTPERIPVLANVENGNTNDKGWNLAFIQKLREILSKEEWDQLIYQADLALITTDNLREMRGNLHFISRLPETFKISHALKEKAWKNGEWREHGQLKPQKKAASYKIQSFIEELDEHPYRFVVVYSDKLNEQKGQTFQRNLRKEQTLLEKAIEKFETTTYHCEADAQEAWEAFQKAHSSHYFHYSCAIQPEQQAEKRTTRGRPKKGETPTMITVYPPRLHNLKENEEAIEEKKRKLSTFILITDKLDRDELSDVDVLQTYKGQEAAETRFLLLKDPRLIDGFFLKKPSRIEALRIVIVMALLIYGILEHRVRKNRKQEEKPLVLAGNSKLFRPTGQVLLKELQEIKVIYIQQNGKVLRYLPDNIGEQAKRILELAGYDLSIYVSKKKEKVAN